VTVQYDTAVVAQCSSQCIAVHATANAIELGVSVLFHSVISDKAISVHHDITEHYTTLCDSTDRLVYSIKNVQSIPADCTQRPFTVRIMQLFHRCMDC
jgi:hypothetical protein